VAVNHVSRAAAEGSGGLGLWGWMAPLDEVGEIDRRLYRVVREFEAFER
jgi:hypothetical protein